MDRKLRKGIGILLVLLLAMLVFPLFFYALEIVDTDGDRLTDKEEVMLGTDPTNPDTDGDGVDDYTQIMVIKDLPPCDKRQRVIRAASALQKYGVQAADIEDSDGDGIVNGIEIAGSLGYVTDPDKVDTDGDGLWDLREYWWLCDPTDPDTNDDGIEDGPSVDSDKDRTYPYKFERLNKDNDVDEDGLPTGAEKNDIGTDFKDASTDGDRYDDGQEYFKISTKQNPLPAFVEADPFVPATPEIVISVDPDIVLDLKTDITIGDKTMESGSHSWKTEESTSLTVTVGAKAELSYKVEVGWPPWKSGGNATAKSSIYAGIEATGSIGISAEQSHATVDEWSRSEVQDLGGSQFRTTVKVKNIGTDWLTSGMDEIGLNCYMGDDEKPFYTWSLTKDGGLNIKNLGPGDEAEQTVTVPCTFVVLKAFELEERMQMKLNYYSFGDDQIWLENAKARCVEVNFDDGSGSPEKHYLAADGITLREVCEKAGINMVVSEDGSYITSINGKEVQIGKNNLPYKWWAFYFSVEGSDVAEHLQDTLLHKGDLVFLTYEIDTDGDMLSDNTEKVIGTDLNKQDTDGDGLTDGQSEHELGLLGEIGIVGEMDDRKDTHPLLPDTDFDGFSDGDEVGNGWNPLDPNDPLGPIQFVTKWGSPGNGNGQFNGPSGVAVDNNGYVYVADSMNNRVQKFDSDGNHIKSWGSGGGDGQFDGPNGVAVDNNGYVYVADTGNYRVQKFDSNGNHIKSWGSLGDEDGQFFLPIGITVGSSGAVYVADTENDRVQKFDSDGNHIKSWGSLGDGDGQFNDPFGMAVDNNGYVYVVDTMNDRVQKFDSDGNHIKSWGSQGDGDGQFNAPIGIAVDSTRAVYVADGNNRVQKFDPYGNFIESWGSPGGGDGQFNAPFGIAVDSTRAVYVSDTDDSRVQVFKRPLKSGKKRVTIDY